MKIVIKCLLISAVISIGATAHAWEGYDYEQNSYIEIEKGNLVRTGRDIDYYDYSTGEYRYGTVESIQSGAGSVELEVYDHDSGQYRHFEMDRPFSTELPSLPGLPSLR